MKLTCLSILTFAALLAATGVPAAAQAQPQAPSPDGSLVIPLAFEHINAPGGLNVSGATHEVPLMADRPDGRWRLPRLTTGRPVYGVLNLAGRPHLLILDRIKAGDPTFNRIYFDLNGNGDLTDDPVMDLTGSSQTPTFDFQIQDGGMTLPMALSFTLSDRTAQVFAPAAPARSLPVTILDRLRSLVSPGKVDVSRISVIAMYDCLFRGQFTLGGNSYSLFMEDDSLNGRYGDQSVFVPDKKGTGGIPFFAGDSWYLTTTGSVRDWTEYLALGEYIALQGKTYRIQLDLPKRTVTLAPLAGPKARLKISPHTHTLFIEGQGDKGSIMAYDPTDGIDVPPGAYRAGIFKLSGTDDQGAGWEVMGGTQPQTPWVSVGAGEAARLPYGEPFNVKISVKIDEAGPTPGGSVSAGKPTPASGTFRFSVLDAAGDPLSNLVAPAVQPTPAGMLPGSWVEQAIGGKPSTGTAAIAADGSAGGIPPPNAGIFVDLRVTSTYRITEANDEKSLPHTGGVFGSALAHQLPWSKIMPNVDYLVSITHYALGPFQVAPAQTHFRWDPAQNPARR